MRIAGRLTAGIAVTAMIVMAGMIAPAARASVTTAGSSTEAPAAQAVSAQAVSAQAVSAQAVAPPATRSRWAELANAETGTDLWSRSSVRERPMGSITKVMTAYVVLTTPGLNLNQVVTVPSGIVAYDEAYDASTAGLQPGERLTTLQLLYAMLLPSGCDAAYTLAGAYGPGLTAFIAKMNATAGQLGLAHTHFTDFSGLPDPTENSTYSTARDLIALGRDAMMNKTFAAIVATREYQVAAGDDHLAHVWKNLDPLLGNYPGAIGIKTGYTLGAGQCLLFEAKRGNETLIGVVLDSSGADSSGLTAAASDAMAMLDWGWRQ